MTEVVNPGDVRTRIGHLSAERRTVLLRQLAERRSGPARTPPPAPRPPTTADLTLECSHAQRRVWLAAGIAPDGSGLHVTTAIRLTGPLDVAALRRAVSTVVARHDGLRTVADDSGPGVRQRVRADATVELRRVELAPATISATASGSAPGTAAGTAASGVRDVLAEARDAVETLRRERFDLRRGPLLRAALLRLGADDHVLVLVGHHFVMDGGSMGVVVRELAAVYTATVRRTPVPLPPHVVHYPDVSAWQWDLLGDGRLERSLDYWRTALAGVGDPLDLPLRRPDEAADGGVGVRRFGLDARTARPLGSGGLAPGLLAVYTVLLARYTGRWDQVVGVFVAGRTRAEAADVVGNFTNLVAVRTDLTDRPGFAVAAARVRAALAGALAHQDAPFDAVVATARPPRVVGRPPLVQVAFNLHNHAYGHATWHGLGAEVWPVRADHDDLDLTLVAVPNHDGTVRIDLEYPADRFAPEPVAALGRHLTMLAAGLPAEPDRPVSAVPMLPPDEIATLRTWGRGPLT